MWSIRNARLGGTRHRKTARSSRATHPPLTSAHLSTHPSIHPRDGPVFASCTPSCASFLPKLRPQIDHPVEPCLGRYDRLSLSFPSPLKSPPRPSPSTVYKNSAQSGSRPAGCEIFSRPASPSAAVSPTSATASPPSSRARPVRLRRP